jgi:hypothetical protein
MRAAANITHLQANLKATAILDIDCEEVRTLAESLSQPDQSDRFFVQKAHLRLCQRIRPVFSVDEWQPASRTLCKKKGSCSQRMACLEAVARAGGIPTRVRVLQVKGSFWYPRFRLSRPFIPARILLVWPQFFVTGMWVDFDELHASMDRLAMDSLGFSNNGESLFEAVQKTPVDFLGKTCGLACAKPGHDLSKYVLSDDGFFDTRDEVFERFGSFQHTLRGRVFELAFGGRSSR